MTILRCYKTSNMTTGKKIHQYGEEKQFEQFGNYQLSLVMPNHGEFQSFNF